MQAEELSYALVLLQEIAQGYDNGHYRIRALRCLKAAEIPVPNLDRWFAHLMPTPDFIAQIEATLESTAAKKDTAAQ